MSHLALISDPPRSRPSMESWISALRSGDPTAIADCYREHASALLALANRLTGNREDAEDVVHDVFVGLPEALAKYEERGQFIDWLKRITARRALMHQRRSRDRRETPRDVDIFPGASSATDARSIGSDTRSMIGKALEALSPMLRQVFVLKVIEGYSHAEIAALLSIRVGASEVRLNRAIAKLRIALGGNR